jgi:hypothetical protein
MTRTWVDGAPPFLSAANLNALETDVTTALGVPDAALAARVVTGATATALNATYASKANNLSDLASSSTARTNLGLGDAATHPASDFAPASGSANYVPQTGASFYADKFNVMRYGAVGDYITDDSTAINAAITAWYATGAPGKVVFPAEYSFVIGSPITPKGTGLTLFSAGAKIRQLNNDNIITAHSVSFTDLTLDGLDFRGTVNSFPTVPTRARTTSGNGTVSAVYVSGDTDPDNTGGAVMTGLTIKNCKFKYISGLPINIKGTHGKLLVDKNDFYYTMDPGFVAYESVQFVNNWVYGSADNGVSASRGGGQVVITGNKFENICYNAVFVAGFNNQVGPQNFTVTGNIGKNIGLAGAYLDGAAKYGTVSGNDFTGGYNRGPSDNLTDAGCVGIFIGGNPTNNRSSPTDYGEGLVIGPNVIRQFPRAGVYANGIRNSLISNNLCIDIGTQYLADGTTAISAADQTQNVGILIDNASLASNVIVSNNPTIDTRATPYCNWGVVPVGSSHVNEYFNEMIGCRSAYNLVETGPTRNINWAAVFQQNTKHTAGATVGSNAGTGLIPGFDTNGAAGSNRPSRWLTAGVERWRGGADNTAESGSNVGTDWVLSSYDDSGTGLATILRATRKGSVTLGVQGQPITLNAKVVSGASSVTGITAGAQATSAAAGGNGANDMAGTLNATAVASPAAGTLVTVTFGTAYATTPHVVLTPQNAASASCQPYLTRSSTGFSIACATAPGASASLSFDYHVIG